MKSGQSLIEHGQSLIEQFGAHGDGFVDCTSALQSAIDSAAVGAIREVVIPAGTWLSGTLLLRSGITLRLQKGAVLKALNELDKFPHLAHATASRMDLFPWRAFLFGHGLEDLTICGEGTIEAGGSYEIFRDGVADSPDRPYGLHLVECRNLRIEGITLRNSAHWMMRLLKCREVRVSGVTIFNHCNHNNDGMDIDSCDGVIVRDCIIDSCDDALVLKSETTFCCRNVLVSGCLLSSHASAIKLGTASIGGFENVVISDCCIRPSRELQSHHPFNLPAGMTGIDIGCVDGGEGRNLQFHRIIMEGVLNPIFVKLGQRYSTGTVPANRIGQVPGARMTTMGKGVLRDILFNAISARCAGPVASMIFGSEGHAIQNVTLRDITIECRAPTAAPEHSPDWSPKGYPCVVSVAGKTGTPAYGFHFRHIEGLFLDRIEVRTGESDNREMIEFEAVQLVSPLDPCCYSEKQKC